MMTEQNPHPDGIVSPADAIAAARAAVAAWLGGVERSTKLLVFCRFDADGLAAGALLARGLERLGYTGVMVVPSGRGESAFADDARKRLAVYSPAALIVTDLGVNRAGVLHDVPTLLIDHHQPEGEPPGVTVVSGYSWEPIPTSAWLVYEVLAPLVELGDLLWIAAVGTISDLGERAPWPRLDEAKRRWKATPLKEAVALVNAARRASAFDLATPFELLLTADGPKQLAGEQGGAGRLRAYREEVNAEIKEARRAAPRFAEAQPFALIRFSSACQIHPLIAQQWRRRLPKHVVIAANDGYLPGMVAFSARTDRADLNLPQLLRAVDLGSQHASFGHGHDAASGGHLPRAVFGRLLAALGFVEHV